MRIANAIRSGSSPSDCWKVRAVPWKLPCTVFGIPMSASARLITSVASLSEAPSGKLNEIVVATDVS